MHDFYCGSVQLDQDCESESEMCSEAEHGDHEMEHPTREGACCGC